MQKGTRRAQRVAMATVIGALAAAGAATSAEAAVGGSVDNLLRGSQSPPANGLRATVTGDYSQGLRATATWNGSLPIEGRIYRPSELAAAGFAGASIDTNVPEPLKAQRQSNIRNLISVFESEYADNQGSGPGWVVSRTTGSATTTPAASVANGRYIAVFKAGNWQSGSYMYQCDVNPISGMCK